MLEQILKHVPARVLPLIMLAVISLGLLASYTYQFKKPWKEYTEWKSTLGRLQQEQQNISPLDQDIQEIKERINSLNSELHGDGPSLPANQMVAYVIGKLDEIAEKYDVQLDGVRPGVSREVLMFNETPYHVEIKGSYVDLFAWLYEVESKLGPLIIKEYKIEPFSSGDSRRMQLTMVSYRLQPS